MAARALEFTILTAARSGKVLGARWSEFDLENAVWTIPAKRMKASKEHRVPLAQPVLALLQGLYSYSGDHADGFVFVGVRPGTGLSAIGLYKAMKKLRPHETVHGFRSTFRTWASERTSYPDIIAEMSLAHTIGSAVEKAYQRSDLFEKRRKLMAAWAEYCTSPVVKSDKVVAIR